MVTVYSNCNHTYYNLSCHMCRLVCHILLWHIICYIFWHIICHILCHVISYVISYVISNIILYVMSYVLSCYIISHIVCHIICHTSKYISCSLHFGILYVAICTNYRAVFSYILLIHATIYNHHIYLYNMYYIQYLHIVLTYSTYI